MLAALLWVLGGLLIAVLLVLCLPVRLIAHAQTEPQTAMRVRVSLLGGLVPSFPVFNSQDKAPKKAKKAQTKRQKASKTKQKRDGKSGSPLRWARAIPQLVTDVLREIHIERLQAHAVFGLDDPADTGALFGQLTPLIYGLSGWTDISLDLRPDFGRACVAGECDATVKLTPIRLVPPFVRFGRNLLRAKGNTDGDHTSNGQASRRT